MSKINRKRAVKIITDPTAFMDRVDEIDGTVSFDHVRNVVSTLKQALYNHPDVPALAAPQIGENLRLFVVRTSKTEEDRFGVFLNPIIIKREGTHLSRECNLSLPGKQYIIPRANQLHVAYQKQDGQVDSQTFLGAYAETVQQMIELLDGVMLADYGLDLDDLGGPEAFDSATKKQKTEVLATYVESLREYSADLVAEIDADPELKLLDDTIKFMTGMLTGDITVNKDSAVPVETEENKDGV